MDIITQYLPLFWLAMFLILFISELISQKLYMIWFALSAMIAFVLSVSVGNIIIQVLTFIVFGILLLYTTRPVALKLLTNSVKRSELLYLDVQVIQVVSRVDNIYQVQISDKIYEAYSNEDLQVGELSKVVSFRNNQLLLMKQ